MGTLAWIVAFGSLFSLFYAGSARRAMLWLGLLLVCLAMILSDPIQPAALAGLVNNLIGAAVCAMPFWWAFKKWRRERAR